LEDEMKKLLFVLTIVLALVITGSIGFVQGQGMEKKSVIFATSADATFKEMVPGVSKALLWGDDTKGAYGAFTKFKPGQDNGMHTHTNDVWLTVHKGADIYKDDAGEKRVGPGGFLFVPGGMKHWSGGDAKDGATFYEESSGKFDIVPVK
jgi:quercetin dioxygenase-like cupin family protein